MFAPAFTGSGEPLLVTERSARVMTVVVAVAVLLSVVPFGVLALALTTSLNVAVAPAPNIEIAQLTVPVPPTDGVEQLKAGPLSCAKDRNVVLAGIASVNDALTASLGPRLLS